MDSQDLLPILNAVAVPILLIGHDRKIIVANGSAEALFGNNLSNKDFVRALRHPDAVSCVDKVLGGSAREEAEISLTAPVRSTYNVCAVRTHDPDTDEIRIVFSLHDISHVIETEQMRVDFVANVSHELRSPLTALSGFIETLQGAAQDDAAARTRFLDIMQNEAGRMTRLIDDLLSLSKVEANEHVRPSGHVELTSLVERVVAILVRQARDEHKTIRLEKSDEVFQVSGDEDQLTQVFQNLIENAVKYSHADSEVLVTISRVENVAGVMSPALAVEISDRSDGIAPEHIPRLTERFYRVDKGRSREMGGTGLGLAIVKHIISRHRGRMVIKSQLGEGSTFTIYLPLA